MKKQTIGLMLTASLCVSMLMGCGSSSNADKNSANDSQNEETVNKVEEGALETEQTEVDSSDSHVEEEKNVPESNTVEDNVSISNGPANSLGSCVFEAPGSFSQGYCWIEFYDTDSIDPHQGIYGCIDKTGKMIYYLENTSCPSVSYSIHAPLIGITVEVYTFLPVLS